MYEKRKSFNQKRRIASTASQAQLEALANRVRYGGNPEHKRNPGDFGLTPSFFPRPDKTLCDLAGIAHRAEAERLLGVPLPLDWPDCKELLALRLSQLEKDPSLTPWLLRAMVLRDERAVVGFIGFHQAPGPEHYRANEHFALFLALAAASAGWEI